MKKIKKTRILVVISSLLLLSCINEKKQSSTSDGKVDDVKAIVLQNCEDTTLEGSKKQKEIVLENDEKEGLSIHDTTMSMDKPLVIEGKCASFLYPRVAEYLINDSNKVLFTKSYNLNEPVRIEKRLSRDSIQGVPFQWLRIMNHLDSIPDFYISKFKLPRLPMDIADDNDYEVLGSFASHIEKIGWKYGQDYNSLSLYDEETLWRYTNIMFPKRSMSFLGGIQFINYLFPLDSAKSDMYFTKDEKVWFAVRTLFIYEKDVQFLYKVVAKKDWVRVVVEMDASTDFSEMSRILRLKSQDSDSKRAYVFRELYE
ncbi:hypothetical protein K5X82_08865 [Halosquirtibacter xylanolyticus]|uniref:hypothetical protein n=1 Tax=Halosquirtibacter xylanolyticus TaxID=3374599 RepID=UPI0037487FF7|nr:hypothetical protein K5X82_08865 [Prolixibacteraceae bacterium]